MGAGASAALPDGTPIRAAVAEELDRAAIADCADVATPRGEGSSALAELKRLRARLAALGPEAQKLLSEGTEGHRGTHMHVLALPVPSLKQQAEKDRVSAAAALGDAPSIKKHLTSIFQGADTNANGSLDKDEFFRLLKGMNLGLDDEQMDRLMARTDTNADGHVSYSEWIESAPTLLRAAYNDDAADNAAECWSQVVDEESGKNFWYNRKTEESQWERPAAVPDVSAYLRGRLADAAGPADGDGLVDADAVWAAVAADAQLNLSAEDVARLRGHFKAKEQQQEGGGGEGGAEPAQAPAADGGADGADGGGGSPAKASRKSRRCTIPLEVVQDIVCQSPELLKEIAADHPGAEGSWAELTDKAGNEYLYNQATGESKWKDEAAADAAAPVPAAEGDNTPTG